MITWLVTNEVRLSDVQLLSLDRNSGDGFSGLNVLKFIKQYRLHLLSLTLEGQTAGAKHIFPPKIVWLRDTEHDIFSCLFLKNQ